MIWLLMLVNWLDGKRAGEYLLVYFWISVGDLIRPGKKLVCSYSNLCADDIVQSVHEVG
jgi:hypothetical protein